MECNNKNALLLRLLSATRKEWNRCHGLHATLSGREKNWKEKEMTSGHHKNYFFLQSISITSNYQPPVKHICSYQAHIHFCNVFVYVHVMLCLIRIFFSEHHLMSFWRASNFHFTWFDVMYACPSEGLDKFVRYFRERDSHTKRTGELVLKNR